MPDKSFSWSGGQTFHMNGVAVHEDTLKIKSNYGKSEKMLILMLPTLCITYADIDFQNHIGGEQLNYPDSSVYGPAYFSSPVTITGEKEIERLTYIRGAQRVEIGKTETVIEFPTRKELVIPRLRISKKETAELNLKVPEISITVAEPLSIDIRQFADGRHVGGVCVKKRHPDWRPEKIEQIYDATVHIIDGTNGRALQKAELNVWHWDTTSKRLHLDKSYYADEMGYVHDAHRPSGQLEAFVVHMPGRRAVVRSLRPLAGQKVRLHMRAWPLERQERAYKWHDTLSLQQVGQICGRAADEILKMNNIHEADLKAGLQIKLPCYSAIYFLEPWDAIDWVAAEFGYKDAKELAAVNKVKAFTGAEPIKLPDWFFLYGVENVTLDDIDKVFDLPAGSSTTVGRAYHPDPRQPFPGECIAVPTSDFAQTLRKKGG